MSPLDHLTAALSRSYRLERELCQGGMATELAAESRGSAGVTEVTFAIAADELRGVIRWAQGPERRFSDISRAAASAASMR